MAYFDEENNPYTHVYHITDLHVRPTKTPDLFKTVFMKLEANLREQIEGKRALIVMTGNLYHKSCTKTPDDIVLVRTLLTRLSTIAPVGFVAGFHDLCPGSENDALTATIEESKGKLHFLKKSGTYMLGPNIELVVSSVLDDGAGDDKEHEDGRVRIALYPEEPEQLPSNVDLALIAGEEPIHKVKMACPGKLTKYGYTTWDLATRTPTFVDIDHDYCHREFVLQDGYLVGTDSTYQAVPILDSAFSDTIPDLGSLTLVAPTATADLWELARQVRAMCPKLTNLTIRIDDEAAGQPQTEPEKTFEAYVRDTIPDDKADAVMKIHEEYGVSTYRDALHIKRIELTGFGPFETLRAVDLEKGIVHLDGKSKSGKSTIAVDGLLFALYGQTARLSAKQNAALVNEACDEATATVLFEVGGDSYRVCRRASRKKATRHHLIYRLDLERNGVPVPARLLDPLVGSLSSALNTFVKAQGSTSDFVTGTPQLRRLALTKMLGLGRLTTLDVVRERYRSATTVRELESELLDRQRVLTRYTKEAEAGTKELGRLRIECVVLEKRIMWLRKKEKTATARLQDFVRPMSLINKDVDSEEEEEDGADDPEVAHAAWVQDKCDRRATVQRELDIHLRQVRYVDKELAACAEELVKEREVAECNLALAKGKLAIAQETAQGIMCADELEERETQLRGDVQASLARVSLLQARVDDGQKECERYAGITYGSRCKHCRANKTKFSVPMQRQEDLRRQLRAEEAEYSDIIVQLERVEERIGDHKILISAETEVRVMTLVLEKAEVQADLALGEKARLEKNHELEARITELEKTLAIIDAEQDEKYLAHLAKMKGAAKPTRSSNNMKIQAAAMKAAVALDRIQAEISRTERLLQSYQKRVSVTESAILNATRAVTKGMPAFSETETNLAKAQTRHKALALYADCVSQKSGYPHHIFKHRLSHFQWDMNRTLRSVAQLEVELKSTKTGVVARLRSSNRAAVALKSASGSEAVAVELAARMAGIAAFPAAGTPSLLVIDEGLHVFDKYQNHLEQLVRVLRERYETVLLISHSWGVRACCDKAISLPSV